MATNTTTKRPAKAGARKSTTAAATPSTPARPRTRRISTDLPKGNGPEQFENLIAKAANAAAKSEAAAAATTRAGQLRPARATGHRPSPAREDHRIP